MAMAIVADVIWSVVVSRVAQKVVTRVADSIGISDSTGAFLGSLAGIWAGSAVYGDASGALDIGGAADSANTVAGVSDTAGGVANAPVAPAAPQADAGLLTRQAAAPVSSAAGSGSAALPNAANALPNVANAAAAAESGSQAASGGFWERALNSDRTADVAVSMAGGAAKVYFAGQAAEDTARREEEVDDRNRQSWINSDYTNWAQADYPSYGGRQQPAPQDQESLAIRPGLLTRS